MIPPVSPLSFGVRKFKSDSAIHGVGTQKPIGFADRTLIESYFRQYAQLCGQLVMMESQHPKRGRIAEQKADYFDWLVNEAARDYERRHIISMSAMTAYET